MAHASRSEDHHAKEETHPRRDGWPSCAKSMSWSRIDGEIFCLLQEAKVVIESWRRHSNSVRPHASLGDQPPTPEVFVPACAGQVTVTPEHLMGGGQFSTRPRWHLALPWLASMDGVRIVKRAPCKRRQPDVPK